MKFAGTCPKVAIIGLGNILLTDDGVGVHAVRQMLENPLEGVVVAEIGAAVLRAQELLEESDVVIAIDAVQAGGPPGSIYRFDAVDVQSQLRISLHELGIVGLLRLLPELSRPELIVLGVQPEVINYGTELSPAVQAALDRVVKAARTIAQGITERVSRSSVN
jgi:hydrogenase maturation protease